jgi:hypothetical protein
MRYFVSTELGVANLMQRHFDWASNALWYDEIPNARDASKTLFIMGGKDRIVNAEVSRPLVPCYLYGILDQLCIARQEIPLVVWGAGGSFV